MQPIITIYSGSNDYIIKFKFQNGIVPLAMCAQVSILVHTMQSIIFFDLALEKLKIKNLMTVYREIM